MHDEQKRHYLLTATEAELLACYRPLNETSHSAVAALMASLVMPDCQPFNIPVGLSLVRKG